MVLNTIIFLLTFYLLLISTLGYGLIFNNLFFSKIINFDNENIIHFGFFGLFSLTFISIFSSLFFSHNFIHNLIIHIAGILYFIIIKAKNKNNYLKLIFYISVILLSALFISKTHDDFSYYHLPFTNYLTEQKVVFGMGNIGHGYNLLSSLFFLNSLFYLPYLEHFSFHFGLLFFLIFFNFFIFKEIQNKNNDRAIKFLYLLSLTYFNLSFNRLAEYGTDKAGQLLIVILIIKLLQITCFDKKKIQFQNILYLIPLFILCISLKTYFLSYSLLALVVLIINYKRLLKIDLKLLVKTLTVSLIFLILYFTHHLIATGCLISPLSFTCYGDDLFWAKNINYYERLAQWLELWSKAGAGPNFRVQDTLVYLQNLNWFSNWIEKYFLVKFLDQIGIFLAAFLMIIFFFKKLTFDFGNSQKNKNNLKIIIFYFTIIIIFLIWFFNHPQLRYGGYSIFFLTVSIPLAIFFSKLKDKNFFEKKFIIFIFVIATIFNFKNFNRLNNEFKRTDLYKYDNFPFFSIPEIKYIEQKNDINFKIYRTDGHCWNVPSPCIDNENKIKVKNLFGYYFLYR